MNMGRILTKRAPFESPHQELSIGTKNTRNGTLVTNLWGNEVRVLDKKGEPSSRGDNYNKNPELFTDTGRLAPYYSLTRANGDTSG